MRLAALLVRVRLRSLRNGLRLRGRARAPLVVAAAALVTSVAYVGLFAQAFSVVVATVGPRGQGAALGVVAGLLAFGSWAAKAASSEALRAGSPENEFLLSRPIGLGALVAGRGLADALTDPMGALFLFPVLLAASLVWRLPPAAWLMAAAVSGLVQLGISMLAYTAQVALVRLVRAAAPAQCLGRHALAVGAVAGVALDGRHRRAARSGGAGRAPRARAQLAVVHAGRAHRGAAGRLGGGRWPGRGAGGAGSAGAGRRGGGGAGGGRRALGAGLGGWEEAGAAWADAAAVPRRGGAITAANKDLRLIVRDRTQLLVLVAMPAIFVGVQIFGAAGWAWSTASLARVSCLSYSLALYMTTIGPLTHMQAERRAFWILRAVPVPLGRLLAAKARAWAVIVGATAAVTFAALCFLMPPAPLAAVIVVRGAGDGRRGRR